MHSCLETHNKWSLFSHSRHTLLRWAPNTTAPSSTKLHYRTTTPILHHYSNTGKYSPNNSGLSSTTAPALVSMHQTPLHHAPPNSAIKQQPMSSTTDKYSPNSSNISSTPAPTLVSIPLAPKSILQRTLILVPPLL
jgi:hypothetical protein